MQLSLRKLCIVYLAAGKILFLFKLSVIKKKISHSAMKIWTTLRLHNDLWACRAHELIKNKLCCIKQILTNLNDSGWPCIDMLNRHVSVWLSSSTLQKHIVSRNLWHPSQGTSTNAHWSIWKQPPISGYRIVLVHRIIIYCQYNRICCCYIFKMQVSTWY